jgi:hypothetical protein
MTDIRTIAQELNGKSELHQIGRRQDLRKELKTFAKRPGSSIFTDQTIFDNYAFHHGGRSEHQFNIGFDGSDGKLLRHGVERPARTQHPGSRSGLDTPILRGRVVHK